MGSYAICLYNLVFIAKETYFILNLFCPVCHKNDSNIIYFGRHHSFRMDRGFG